MLAEGVPGSIPIMQNTDGLEMIIPASQKDKYMKICTVWENLTKLELEHDTYQKLIVPDVNNYIAVFDYREVTKDVYLQFQKDNPENLFKIEDGKYWYAPTKCKGRFEFKDLALHKNKSFQIIPKAIFNYFVHNTSPEEYVAQNENIFDFTGAVKIQGGWKLIEHRVEKGEIKNTETQKTVRFYISKTGSKLIKQNISDNRQIHIVSGKWLQTVYNKHHQQPISNYQIDIRFYLERINKELKSIVPENFNNQLSLNL